MISQTQAPPALHCALSAYVVQNFPADEQERHYEQPYWCRCHGEEDDTKESDRLRVAVELLAERSCIFIYLGRQYTFGEGCV